MKKVLFLALLCLPLFSLSQDKSGVPSKGRQTSSFTNGLSTGYDYAVLQVIGEGANQSFVAQKFDGTTSGIEQLGKFPSLLAALHILGNEGYQVIHVEDKKKNPKNISREYLMMKEVPKKKSMTKQKGKK